MLQMRARIRSSAASPQHRMTDYSHFPAAINKLSKPCDEDDQGSDIIRRARSSPRHPVSSAGTPSASGRKPRGRPPGSKNKPKPPVVITRDSEYEMQPVVLQLAAGSDVLGSITAFARRHRVGVSILGGSGAIANAALREPGSSAARFTISGRFDILCLSGSFLPPAADKGSAAAFTISLAGERGEVIGGAVAGPVRAAGPVMVVGATFLAAEYYRLPASREDEGGMEEDGDVKVTTTAVESVVVGQAKQLMGKLSNDMVLWAAAPASSRSICTLPHLHPPRY